MVPLQTMGELVGGVLFLVAFAVGPGLVAALLWSPFLSSDRLSSLFRDLPPGESLLVSYLTVMIGASAPYVIGFYVALIETAGATGAATANAILDVIVPLSLADVVGFPLLAGVLLPRVGIDWDPTGYGPGTWVLLVLGGAWYAAIFAVPSFLFALVLALPTG